MATELATRPPAFVDGKTQSANDMRLNILSGSGGATPLQSRAGVRPSGGNPGLVAALPTPVMKIRVNAGIADVPSSSVTGGFYRVSWDQVDLDIDPSSAQARTDLIIVEVVDTGTSAATGKVRVLKGTSGAGRPSNLVVNAHWWSLAAVAVRVNTESTGNIRPQDVTPELKYAVAPGGITPVRDTDTDAGACDGQYRDHPTWGLQRWSAARSRWEKWGGPPVLIASDPDVGGGANFSGGTLESKTLTVPAHSAGTLHVQFAGSWYAASAQAVTGRLTYGAASGLGSPEVQGSAMRSLNNSVANAPVGFVCDGYIATDGAASTLRLVTTAEVVTNTFILEGAFRAWLD